MGEFKKVTLIFITCFIILNIYIILSINKSNNIKDDIIRFHVVANSNSIEDQLVKLKISSKIEDYISSLNLYNKDSHEILDILKNNSQEFLDISNGILNSENFDYNTSISVGKIYYEDSKDDTLSHMDSGSYNSVKILLGDAKGNNFWGLINPTKENVEKIKKLDTLFPGIKNLYNTLSDDILNKQDKPKSFIVNIIKNRS